MPSPLPKNSQLVFKGTMLSIYQWPQVMFDGTTTTFECCVRPDSIAVLGFLDQNTVLITKQEQPHRSEPFYDLPGGRVEENEALDVAAKREFEEETGYSIETLEVYQSEKRTGCIRLEQGLYLAKGLANIGKQHLDSGERIELVPTSWSDLLQLCLKNKLRNHDTMLAILQMEYEPEARAKRERFLSDVK